MTLLAIEDLITPATGDEWKARLLANAATLELKTTSWQPGGMMRTMFAILSNMFGQEDGIISLIAQGGFLDFAANGSVTYTAANGQTVTQKVTPDPSVAGENPNGTPGWLDLLAQSVFNTQRIGAQLASNSLAIANTTSNTYGPYAEGTYHVTNPNSGAGYHNTQSMTIAPANIVGGIISDASNTGPIVITTSSAHGLVGTEVVYISGVLGNTAANGFWNVLILSTTTFALVGSTGNGAYSSGGTVNVCTVANFAADVAGPDGTSAAGTITETVTVLSGVSVHNVESFVGAEWEGNQALANRCRLKVQSLSPNGPKGSYAYFALTASALLAAENPPVALSSTITRVKTQANSVTGEITTVVASASGDVSGITDLDITAASNTSPIAIATATAHGLSTGDFVSISDVVGNTNANGTFEITVTGATTFTLNESSGNAAYVSGGIVQGGDLGQVHRIIQENCVPDGQTEFTVSASGFDIAIVAAVEVPQENVAIYTAAVQTALALYFASLPIGGIENELQYNDIVGVLYAAGSINGQSSYVRRITSLTLNGSTSNVAYATPQVVAKLYPSPAITVTGV